MDCTPFYKSGLGDCDTIARRAKAWIILDKGQSFTETEVKTLATWSAIIAGQSSQTGMFLPVQRGYQNNTPEPERNTSNLGYTEKTNDPPIQLVGMLKASYCDYRTLYDADHKDFDVIAILEGGKLWMTQNSSGAFVGFRSNFTIRKNAALTDNNAEAFPIYLDFVHMDQLDKAFIITPSFQFVDLENAIPVGLNAGVTVAYAAGDVTVKVTKRCSIEGYSGLTAVTNWEVLSASADLDVDVTAVDATSASLGQYVLTIQKDASTTPATLTDNVVIRGVNDDGTNLTYVTQPLEIVV